VIRRTPSDDVAWVVRDEWDDDLSAEVVFAPDEPTALARAAARTDGERSPGRFSARREPDFDRFASAGFVPPRELVAAGWTVTCDECDGPVCEDDEDAARPEDAEFEGRRCWCGPGCRAAWRERQRRTSAALVAVVGVLPAGSSGVSVGQAFVDLPGGRSLRWSPTWRSPGALGEAWLFADGSLHCRREEDRPLYAEQAPLVLAALASVLSPT